MKILMGTKNPGKIEGAKQAFEKYFDNVEIEGVKVTSEVSDQPFNKEIIEGAKNRVKNLKEYAKKNNIEADFYISSEAGIMNYFGEWIDVNIAYVEDKEGLSSTGLSQGFPIPEKYLRKSARNSTSPASVSARSRRKRSANFVTPAAPAI